MKSFDRWANSGDFSLLDLSLYRVIYSCLVLLTLPQLVSLSEFPRSFFDPPFGPLRLLPELPSRPVLILIQILLAFSLACLAVGFRTRTASLATGILLAISYGLGYSFGKIDHTILVVLVPLVLCWAGWGRRLSYDNTKGSEAKAGTTEPPQWPLRLLSVLVGLAFLTAAMAKLDSGWLSPSSQSARGHFLRRHFADGQPGADGPGGVPSWLLSLDSSAVWESIDWLTVGLEVSVILSVVMWRAFRVMLAAACLFHLSIMLSLGIAFSGNVIVYGSFVGWACLAIGARRLIGRLGVRDLRLSRGLLVVLIPGLTAVALYFQDASSQGMRNVIEDSVVVAGACFAIVYLLVQTSRLRTVADVPRNLSPVD